MPDRRFAGARTLETIDQLARQLHLELAWILASGDYLFHALDIGERFLERQQLARRKRPRFGPGRRGTGSRRNADSARRATWRTPQVSERRRSE